MAYRTWTEADRATIVALHESTRLSWKVIGQIVGRSANACASQYHLEKQKRGDPIERKTAAPMMERPHSMC